MALGQGTIFTASEAAKALRENSMDYQGQNPWTNAYGAVNLQKDQAFGQLDTSYSKQLNDAYLSSLQQTNLIRNSNLGQGYQDLALKENEALLNQAFESYRNSYLENKGTIENNAAKYVSQIDQALTSQATNQAKLGNMIFEYLPALYEKDKPAFENDPNYARFLVDDGAGGKRLMTTGELSANMFNEKTGELTDYGVDVLSMLDNYASIPGYSLGDFIAEKDPELMDWLYAADPYNYGKSNVDTFRYLTGNRKEGEWNRQPSAAIAEEFSNKFSTGIEGLRTKYDEGHKSEGDAEAFMTDLNTQYAALKTYAKQIGVYDEEVFNEFETKIAEYNNVIANPGEGNNRKNREYATSNAFADYEQLVNKIFGKTGSSVQRTKSYEERKKTYKVEEGYYPLSYGGFGV